MTFLENVLAGILANIVFNFLCEWIKNKCKKGDE